MKRLIKRLIIKLFISNQNWKLPSAYIYIYQSLPGVTSSACFSSDMNLCPHLLYFFFFFLQSKQYFLNPKFKMIYDFRRQAVEILVQQNPELSYNPSVYYLNSPHPPTLQTESLNLNSSSLKYRGQGDLRYNLLVLLFSPRYSFACQSMEKWPKRTMVKEWKPTTLLYSVCSKTDKERMLKWMPVGRVFVSSTLWPCFGEYDDAKICRIMELFYYMG